MGSVRIKPEGLARKLQAIRTILDCSQSAMAQRLSDEKVSLRKSDISRYESGLREPPLIILLRYARLAKVSMESLADDEIDCEFFRFEQKSETVS